MIRRVSVGIGNRISALFWGGGERRRKGSLHSFNLQWALRGS